MFRNLLIFGAVAIGLCLASLFGPGATPAQAQACAPNCSPAKKVPVARWDGIEPVSILGDMTGFLFNGHKEPGCDEPFRFQLDLEAGLIFAATGSTLEIWDTRTNATQPPRIASICKPVIGSWKKSDKDWYATSVAAPPRASDGTPPPVVAVGLEEGMGLSVVDVSTPSSPTTIYQNEGSDSASYSMKGVHATRIAGRDYAIAVNDELHLLLYDLTKAAQLARPCRETTDNRRCKVFQSKLTYDSAPLNSFFKITGVGPFILVRWSSKTRVFDLTPSLSGEDARFVAEIGPNPKDFAAWLEDGELYFAVVVKDPGELLRIYRVPCAFGEESCDPVLVSSSAVPGGPHPGGSILATDTVTFSRDGEQEYLFAGTTTIEAGGPQREYLFDVSDPAEPRELTPQVHEGGYWGWYYEESPTGFRHVRPLTGLVRDAYLYRSAWSILDVHELVGLSPPIARFDLPGGTVLGGQQVQFTDRSARGPTQWQWKFLDGTELLATKTARHPSWTVPTPASYPHDYRIRLRVWNDLGTDATEKILTVHDPAAPPLELDSFRTDLFCVADICPTIMGTPVPFTHVIEGTPESYDYDWDGDGDFEDTGYLSPVDSHAYPQPGDYRPVLRITAGATVLTRQIDDLIRVALDPALLVFEDDFEDGDLDSWSQAP